jgi:hypothetical protein
VLAFRKSAHLKFRLQDFLALVVGYGLAALLFRAFWPSSRPSPALGVPGIGLYLWLGLAMSGPIILLRKRPRDPAWPEPGYRSPRAGAQSGHHAARDDYRGRNHAERDDHPGGQHAVRDDYRGSVPAGARTWAELAWLLIGIYWIVLGIFVIPARLHEFRLGDSLLFGLVPIIVGLALRLFGPKPTAGTDAISAWTHTAAIALLATWPVAWLCLIVLGTTIR